MADTVDTAVKDLRHELKAWEKLFAAANGGRKAGREDIKKDATISAKYKEYDRLTRKVAHATSTPRKRAKLDGDEHETQVLKDRPANVVSRTPRRESRSMKDPQAIEIPAILEDGPTPAIIRYGLGPTPQKDGALLGIFDVLSAGTPSKSGDVSIVPPDAIIAMTPSKKAMQPSPETRLSKTPQSSAKRNFLDAFAATPLKRKREDGMGHTPSTSKRQYATPAFLRRGISLPRIDEESLDHSVAAPPFKKRGLVRSLTTIIQGLKKQEDERMDDEWDIMNEIEAEERGEVIPAKPSKVFVEDNEAPEMPLGPDRGVESEEDLGAADAGALDANGNPRKVWKKKGLKRQTKRVKMRPVLHKPKKAAENAAPESEESELDTAAGARLPDKPSKPANDGDGKDEDAGGSDYKHDSRHSSQQPTERASKKKATTEGKGKKTLSTDGENVSSKAKKVNPLAHANFRRLKIKNKNSKAKGKGGRFGRR